MEVKNHPTREELSGYALQSLEIEETRALREHLATCPECREILADYDQIASGLLFAVPPKAPPPQLRSRLAERIHAGQPSQAVPARRATHFPWVTAALGLAAIALLVFSLYLFNQVNRLQQQQAVLIQALQKNQEVIALIAEPGVTTVPFQSGTASGNLLIGPDGKTAVLFTRGLPELDPAHTYQVWLIPPSGAPASAGLMPVQPGQAQNVFLLTSNQPLKNYAALGVTVEPRSGSPAPTTKPVLVVNL